MADLIDVSVLKEWIENWFTKNRHYHPYAKSNNIPITELYDILEQMPSAHPTQTNTPNALETLDCVSRQAAIDAVKCGALSAATVYGRTDEGSTALYETVKAIKALPSAQPEIVRCKDCVHKWVAGEERRYNICFLNHNKAQDDDWFCADAERRTDEAD